MGLTREERIARALAKEWPGEERHHYVLVASPEHGVVACSGVSSPRMRALLGLVLKEALGIDLPPCSCHPDGFDDPDNPCARHPR